MEEGWVQLLPLVLLASCETTGNIWRVGIQRNVSFKITIITKPLNDAKVKCVGFSSI